MHIQTDRALIPAATTSVRYLQVLISDQVDTVLGRTPASTEAKGLVYARMHDIDARGSTNLAGGWHAPGILRVKASASRGLRAMMPPTRRCRDEGGDMRPTSKQALARVAVTAYLLTAVAGADGRQIPADEAGVSSTLRAIASGQLTYSVVCATGFFAPTLEVLARPAKGDKAGFILDTDVPKPGSKVLQKYGYRVEMTAPASPLSPASCNGVPAGGSAQTFVVTARPLPGASGKSFRIDEKGELTAIK